MNFSKIEKVVAELEAKLQPQGRLVCPWDDGSGTIEAEIAAMRADGRIRENDRVIRLGWLRQDESRQTMVGAGLESDSKDTESGNGNVAQ